MKGIHPQLNGKWRVNIMVHRERMSKVCETYEQALHTARCIRYHLTLKYYGHTIKGQHAMNTMKEQTTGNFAPITTTTPTTTATTINTPVIPQTFTFPMTGQGVRIVQKDDEPWFVAKDVCDCLGLVNPTVSIAALDADERAKVFLGRQGEANIVSESGLYALVFRSNKPEARAFSKWVRSEVLPTIRRTGGYIMAAPSETPEILMARALFVAKDAIDRVNAQLAAAQPKVEAYDTLLNTEGTYTVTEAAKHFNMSAMRLNEILVDENWMFKRCVDKNGKEVPTVHMPRQHIVNRGFAVVKTRKPLKGGVYSQTFITAQGLVAMERMMERRYPSSTNI